MNCIVCGNVLKGRQTKYCKRGCESSIWRKNNPEKNKLYTQKSRQNHKMMMKSYIDNLKRQPCTDCGIAYHPYVMDFDHVKGIKIGHVSQLLYKSLAAIKEEVAKCELVCANCHRLRTLKRMMN